MQITLEDRRVLVHKCMDTFELYSCEASFDAIDIGKVSYATNIARRAAKESCAFWPIGSDLRSLCEINYEWLKRPPTEQTCSTIKKDW